MLRISEFSDQGVRWRYRDVSRYLILDISDFVIQGASKTRNLTTSGGHANGKSQVWIRKSSVSHLTSKRDETWTYTDTAAT
jgi:hypothetical protein